jgi:hypothetical protein
MNLKSEPKILITGNNTMQELTTEKVQEIIGLILNILGEPLNATHQEAIQAFSLGQYEVIKRLAVTNLDDNYLKSLSYLGGALKLTPNTDTILAESARAAADFIKQRALKRLSEEIELIYWR